MRSKNQPNLSESEISRVIEMAWEDRTPFEAIEHQFGINEQQTKELMRANMKPSSYKMWRKRVHSRDTKHGQKRSFVSGRFKSQNQK